LSDQDDYQPGAPRTIQVRPGAGGGEGDDAGQRRWTLVFARELDHPPQRVWRALTDPAELSAWAPFDASRDLAGTGPAVLTMAGARQPGAAAALAAEVGSAETARSLEYTWGDDLLRWELEPIAGGTRLTLFHTVSDRQWLSQTAAGWHICLDVASHHLAGTPVGRIVAEQALAHGWQRLNDAYAVQLDQQHRPDQPDQAPAR
jgi:uncharacterized protein YndB with AHSA1/START domain